jgi:hypothetical protein
VLLDLHSIGNAHHNVYIFANNRGPILHNHRHNKNEKINDLRKGEYQYIKYLFIFSRESKRKELILFSYLSFFTFIWSSLVIG